MDISKETVEYIISFLINDSSFTEFEKIKYGKKDDEITPLFIYQSNFFDEGIYGGAGSLRNMPLPVFEGVPFLYGDSRIIRDNGRIILYVDWIASAYFFVSRYEEYVLRNKRDEHGRIPCKHSLVFKSGNICNPLIDMWGKQLRDLLREVGIVVKEPKSEFNSITLTHDIDMPWNNYSFAQSLRRCASILKHEHRIGIWPLLAFWGKREADSKYTFDEIVDMDKKLPAAQSIYFVVATDRKDAKGTFDYINTKAFKDLAVKLKNSDAEFGWHISYEAADDFRMMQDELALLNSSMGSVIKSSRNHYLRSKEPEDFEKLIDLGITDDYTMGYAGHVGFRLGTARKVRWINPCSRKVTRLVMHPLQIMECSLTAYNYMNADEKQAANVCLDVINKTREYNGDLVLLWHNTTFSYENKLYTRTLYDYIINYLCDNAI